MNRMDAAIAEMERTDQETVLRRYRGRLHGERLDARVTRLRQDTRLEILEAEDQARDRTDRAYWNLSERIEQLALMLVHANVLPWRALHELLDEGATDQYGSIPGCRCGPCPVDHVEHCSCRECRAAADAAWRNSPEGIEQRRLAREFWDSDG